MEILDVANSEEKSIRVSGTLDAVAMYIEREFKFDQRDAAKVATLLWLEQESELAEATRTPELNADLKSLREFGDEDRRAQGMIAQSRVFMDLEKTKVAALQVLPAEVVDALLSTDGLPTKVLRMLFRIVYAVVPTFQLVPEGLSCVCMRAWDYVKRREHIPFQVVDVMPGREFSREMDSRRTCELTKDDGQQHLGHAAWQCRCHEGENYCTLTPEKAGDMLCALSKMGVLEDFGNGSYAFK